MPLATVDWEQSPTLWARSCSSSSLRDMIGERKGVFTGGSGDTPPQTGLAVVEGTPAEGKADGSEMQVEQSLAWLDRNFSICLLADLEIRKLLRWGQLVGNHSGLIFKGYIGHFSKLREE